MKRLISVLIISVLLLAICVGCGSDAPARGVETDDTTTSSPAGNEGAATGGQTQQTGADQTTSADSTASNDTADESATQTGDSAVTAPEGDSDTQSSSETDTETDTDTDTSSQPSNSPSSLLGGPSEQYTNPLTGETTSIDYSSYRPYAITIDQVHDAWPQDGISYADIVYEMAAYSGGVTRCLAIYQDLSVAERIGGIRSARSQFVDVAMGYDALFVHVGGSDEAKVRMRQVGCDSIDAGLYTWFPRDPWREANIGYSHAVVADTAQVLENVEGAGFRVKHEEGYSYGLQFAEEVQFTDAQTVTYVSIDHASYDPTVFEYDEATGKYYGSKYGEEWVDHLNGQQLCFTNVLIIKAESRNSGNYHLHDFSKGGTGYYLNGGRMVEITWTKESADAPFQYFYADGTPIVLGVGKTYIGIWTKFGALEFEKPE